MSPKIHASRHCADACCSRIDLHPSRLAAAAWLAWLVLAGLMTGFAIDLPVLVRACLCVFLAIAGSHNVRVFVLLAGSRAVRAIEWNDHDEFFVLLGRTLERHPATISNESFRLGARFWVLRFATSTGSRTVLVEEAGHNLQAFRRLSRHLSALSRRGSGRRDRPADTIRPKV